MPTLPPAFLNRPLAHRALHDVSKGRPENSRAAIRAAIDAGYGIEIDLQLSADGRAMVFHDYDLGRLTPETGPIRQRSASELARLPLKGGDGETIPTLTDVLDLIAGQVPLLIEIKDQDGAMGSNVGPLEYATAQALADYDGPVALMSFNPHAVEVLSRLLPDLPRGLTTCRYNPLEWPLLPDATCDHLRLIPDYDRVGASFVSHNVEDLHNPRLTELRVQNANILCWTVTSAEQEVEARKVVDNVTFEGYLA
ncbi:glycerophosphodiester phosphodiesterase family protein [Alisedimentitalea sp. MJ-SS2]|uniref:glycerophosphodiester phosphodiesterase family protein n=1 Tax=Aliisedimentitalea sp. MJ-SS2 TaxID=3049795 RepID=UPI002910B907|nr:glycerophosphodiester phosphodiesterase family protein [Alisedimentitalea sp. MJ-SS2]MDU8927619.1 glycerophosphodiester phosphodiesterase family protein [Alisedimentitalea sp. MJ-SS2]